MQSYVSAMNAVWSAVWCGVQVFDSEADQRHIDTPIFTVQSIASTARVKWRPQWTYHLSSCAQLLDFSLNVWDIRRPYIPVAVFSRHKDVVTGSLPNF